MSLISGCKTRMCPLLSNNYFECLYLVTSTCPGAFPSKISQNSFKQSKTVYTAPGKVRELEN